MKRYVITKSMNRIDRCKLIIKLQDECFENGKYQRVTKELKSIVKTKKRAELYRSKKTEIIYSTKMIKHKGIHIYVIMDEKYGIQFIFNTSAIDAPYVEYMLLTPIRKPVIFNEHLLKRYNERTCNFKHPTFKSIIMDLCINNDIGRIVSNEDTDEVVQRINSGFILGKKYKDYFILNTFYDNEENKDTALKEFARYTGKYSELSFEKI